MVEDHRGRAEVIENVDNLLRDYLLLCVCVFLLVSHIFKPP